jgi:uncharacterized LabA/DUF88 family protein
MRTHVYIDGFNFYYGCVRNTPFKWLDFGRLCAHLLPPNQILSIKYFGARVEARPDDPGKPTRQETWFRALRTIPHFEIILGQFLTHAAHLPRADGRGFVNVLRTEEKGSDVNLATHLVHDAHLGSMECAVIISNDSDLAEPLRIVHEEIGLTVGIVSPTLRSGRHPSRELVRHADFVKRVRKGVLQHSQFPNPVMAPGGPVFKPSRW